MSGRVRNHRSQRTLLALIRSAECQVGTAQTANVAANATCEEARCRMEKAIEQADGVDTQIRDMIARGAFDVVALQYAYQCRVLRREHVSEQERLYQHAREESDAAHATLVQAKLQLEIYGRLRERRVALQLRTEGRRQYRVADVLGTTVKLSLSSLEVQECGYGN